MFSLTSAKNTMAFQIGGAWQPAKIYRIIIMTL
jgi:hypothetical protein